MSRAAKARAAAASVGAVGKVHVGAPGEAVAPAAAAPAEDSTVRLDPRPRFELLPVSTIKPSGTNPKSRSDEKAIEELTKSVRQDGVLEPISVRPARRPNDGPEWVVIFGHRRLAAATAAGLESIPALVRDVDELKALELQLIENVQRRDLHPIEEAEGYQRLRDRGYDVARIAARTGRSVAYVYDRMKLTNLSQRARNLFLDEVLTPGHAILLARLKPLEQDRALKLHECIHEEHLLFRPEGPDGEHLKEKAPEGGTLLRACSVREMQSWIDKNVRFDASEPDPLLFPETAATIASAREGKDKIVAITYMHYVPDQAREGKTYCRMSWKRADGKEGSKTCTHAVTGFVAVGARRTEAFPVCVAKERCTVHWAKQVKAKQRRAAERLGVEDGDESPAASKKADRKPSWQVEQERRDAAIKEAKERWAEIRDRVINASIEKFRTTPANASSPLGRILARAVNRLGGGTPKGVLPAGSSPEQLVRHLVSLHVLREMTDTYDAHVAGPRLAAELGVDLAEMRKRAKAEAEPKKPAAKKKAVRVSKKRVKK